MEITKEKFQKIGAEVGAEVAHELSLVLNEKLDIDKDEAALVIIFIETKVLANLEHELFSDVGEMS